jgi:voltage-gated potassium channel Kch
VNTLRSVVRVGGVYRWYILTVGAMIAFVLGTWGWWLYLRRQPGSVPYPVSDAVYWSVKDFLFNSPSSDGLPWQLDVARFLAPAVAGWAGLTALSLVFRDRIQQMRIPLMRRHVVVCGLGDHVGSVFVRHLREHRIPTVVVEVDATNPGIEVCRDLGVPVLIGDAQRSRTLHAAGAPRASRLLAITPDDAVNTQIVATARDLVVGERAQRLRSLALITNPDFCRMLRIREAQRRDPDLSVDFFNIDEIGARLLLEAHPVDTSSGRPHIVVAHLDPLGVWVIYHAARSWYDHRDPADSAPLVVTVIDDAAADRIDGLLSEHPALERACKLNPLPATTRDMGRLAAHHLDEATPPICGVYVTAYDDAQVFETALKIRDELDTEVPVVAALSRTRGVAALIDDAKEAGALSNIDVFFTMEHTCTVELVRGGSFEPMARVIHDRWREAERQAGREAPTWEHLDESRRESSREQARDIAVKLRLVGCAIAPLRDWDAQDFTFTEEEIEILGRAEHERWNRERIASGWTLGPRNTEIKQTPYLVPFDELPADIADYDRILVREIPAALATVGLQVIRLARD